jgi:hypothetical protein
LINRCIDETSSELVEATADLYVLDLFGLPKKKVLIVFSEKKRTTNAEMEVLSLKKQVSVLKSELDVEQILAEETYELFSDACRSFRVPRSQRPGAD